MITHPALVALWIGALCARAQGIVPHLDDRLGDLAERLVREIGTPIRA